MMKRRHIIGYTFWVIPALLTTLVITNCQKEVPPPTPPEASYEITPSIGNTTTIFDFDANGSKSAIGADTMLFFRWDWNNDGLWDTGFSRSRRYSHRFLIPGTYQPTLEVRNTTGLTDTLTVPIEVVQGYSKPRPVFTVNPPTGHMRTEFTFDASDTRDDEDSLNTLKFRWDFENDGIFDTEYTSDPSVAHIFGRANMFQVTLDVLDPSGLNAILRKNIAISNVNTALVADFTWTPANGSTADIWTFDASNSYDPDDPNNQFSYRWDFDSDGQFETGYLASATVEHKFEDEGEGSVTMEMKDQWGLVKRVAKEFTIAHANKPPVADFFTAYEYGNLTTNFYFDATNTKDSEDWEYQISCRWDFDSDGVWDTGYSVDRVAYHQFGGTGDYKVTMEAMDSGELTDTTSLIVHVSNGTNETGQIIDINHGWYYGTIKIGNQWWMAENLREKGGTCYSGRIQNCETYGSMYQWSTAMGNSTQEKAQGLCPDGWHIPTVAEWQTLIDYLGGEAARSQLDDGGPTDFRMLYGGQRAPTGRYEYQGVAVNYWTSTAGSGSNSWSYSFQAGKDAFWKLSLGRAYGNFVRCIKN